MHRRLPDGRISVEDPWAMVRREIDRSRRHAHPLALLLMSGYARHDRQALAGVAHALDGMLRAVDSVWVDRDGIFVLLPESGRAGAEGMVARLPALAATPRLSLACFPEDGLTAGALRAALRCGDGQPRALRAEPATLVAALSRPPSEKATG